MKSFLKKLLCASLAICMIVSLAPPAFAQELTFAEEASLGEEILGSNVFYLASGMAVVPEEAQTGYAVRLGRGGDCAEAASVLVKIADFTARYGTDYTVALLNEGEFETDGTEFAFVDLMSGEYSVGTNVSGEALEEELVDVEDAPAVMEDGAVVVDEMPVEE